MTITLTDDIDIGVTQTSFTLSELFRDERFQEAYEDFIFGRMIEEGDRGDLASREELLIALKN